MGRKDTLQIIVSRGRQQLGRAAAGMVARTIQELLLIRPCINMIFAAAPSQEAFLAALVEEKKVDWTKINGFHMDEYIGLPEGRSQLFGQFLKKRLFDLVPFRSVNLIDPNPVDSGQECERYSRLLADHPPDIVCLGVGENTHIAFNEPHLADFNDGQLVRKVWLDSLSRVQQVHDGCFKRLEDVPERALTLTIPALMQAKWLFCMVPGKTKREAVRRTLQQEVSEQFPSTILRRHNQSFLFVDKDSYPADLLK